MAQNGVISEHYLSPGVLDEKPATISIAYVLAAVNVRAWHLLTREWEKVPEIKEAGLVYGSSTFDAVIKIQAHAERINEIVLRNINSQSFVRRTKTLQAVDKMHWQKAQLARQVDPAELIKGEDLLHEMMHSDDHMQTAQALGLQHITQRDYPSRKLKAMFEAEAKNKFKDLHEMADGYLKIKRPEALNNLPTAIVNMAVSRVRAVVVWNQVSNGECERAIQYLKAQKERIAAAKRDKFEVLRVFVVNSPQVLLHDEALHRRIGYELYCKVSVRVITEVEWPQRRKQSYPVDFGLMDNQLYWAPCSEEIADEDIRYVAVSLKHVEIERFSSDFEAVWNKAKPLGDEVRDKCIKARESFAYLCGEASGNKSAPDA